MEWFFFICGSIVGFVVGCCASAREDRTTRGRDNLVRIDNARRYHMAKNGEL